MSYSGEAADQVVRISLNGAEVAAKLSGSAAKEIAVMLYAIFRDSKKSKGKTRLSNLLKSGKELSVFAVRDEDLAQFCKAAKEYGVLYCVLKDKDANDGITDLMVKAEDAQKINRIYERFQLATVNRANIKTELVKDIEKQSERSIGEKLMDKMMQKDEPVHENEGEHAANPPAARSANGTLSEPTYTTTRDTDDSHPRPSVIKELREIQALIQEKAKENAERSTDKVIEHIVPAAKSKSKGKER